MKTSFYQIVYKKAIRMLSDCYGWFELRLGQVQEGAGQRAYTALSSLGHASHRNLHSAFRNWVALLYWITQMVLMHYRTIDELFAEPAERWCIGFLGGASMRLAEAYYTCANKWKSLGFELWGDLLASAFMELLVIDWKICSCIWGWTWLLLCLAYAKLEDAKMPSSERYGLQVSNRILQDDNAKLLEDVSALEKCLSDTQLAFAKLKADKEDLRIKCQAQEKYFRQFVCMVQWTPRKRSDYDGYVTTLQSSGMPERYAVSIASFYDLKSCLEDDPLVISNIVKSGEVESVFEALMENPEIGEVFAKNLFSRLANGNTWGFGDIFGTLDPNPRTLPNFWRLRSIEQTTTGTTKEQKSRGPARPVYHGAPSNRNSVRENAQLRAATAQTGPSTNKRSKTNDTKTQNGVAITASSALVSTSTAPAPAPGPVSAASVTSSAAKELAAVATTTSMTIGHVAQGSPAPVSRQPSADSDLPKNSLTGISNQGPKHDSKTRIQKVVDRNGGARGPSSTSANDLSALAPVNSAVSIAAVPMVTASPASVIIPISKVGIPTSTTTESSQSEMARHDLSDSQEQGQCEEKLEPHQYNQSTIDLDAHVRSLQALLGPGAPHMVSSSASASTPEVDQQGQAFNSNARIGSGTLPMSSAPPFAMPASSSGTSSAPSHQADNLDSNMEDVPHKPMDFSNNMEIDPPAPDTSSDPLGGGHVTTLSTPSAMQFGNSAPHFDFGASTTQQSSGRAGINNPFQSTYIPQIGTTPNGTFWNISSTSIPKDAMEVDSKPALESQISKATMNSGTSNSNAFQLGQHDVQQPLGQTTAFQSLAQFSSASQQGTKGDEVMQDIPATVPKSTVPKSTVPANTGSTVAPKILSYKEQKAELDKKYLAEKAVWDAFEEKTQSSEASAQAGPMGANTRAPTTGSGTASQGPHGKSPLAQTWLADFSGASSQSPVPQTPSTTNFPPRNGVQPVKMDPNKKFSNVMANILGK